MEKGSVFTFCVKEDWLCVEVSLSFALVQGIPGKCFLCFQQGIFVSLVGLFLSGHLTYSNNSL